MSPSELALRAYSLRLESDLVDGGTIDWPFNSTEVYSADIHTNETHIEGAHCSEEPEPEPQVYGSAHEAHVAVEDHAGPDSDRQHITYQYALRYAILLDADNAQLAARSHSTGGKRDGALNRTGSENGAFA
ncbi:hypothetical protein GGF43_006013, partial [Coemansia sp. RSA 2618]